MFKKLHHIDIVVHDLDKAVSAYEVLLGSPPLRRALPSRGIETAAWQVGETLIILVSPLSTDSPVWHFLHEHGEGFFHIGLEVEDIQDGMTQVRDQGVRLIDKEPRLALEGWRVATIDPQDTFGATIQLVEP